MVSYLVVPVPDVPPEVNTITFLINPAYVRNGTLDGQVGTAAADDRFHREVPEFRSRLGSLYPASYMRVKQAFELKRQIQQEDKRRLAYFENFDIGLASVFDDSFGDRIGADAAPGEIGVPADETSAPGAPAPGSTNARLDLLDSKLDGLTASQQSAAQADARARAEGKRKEIEATIPDPDKRSHALAAFADWQTRMEDIRIRAGKRNIVNTYVWDADGGLRAEQEEFASTVQHTVGSTATLDASVGGEFKVGVGAFQAELSLAATFSVTQTLSKSAATTRTLGLEVDLGGLEAQGITDSDDRALVRGEKVNRYRFMTFYLGKSTRNFQEFFSQVVDPEWLLGNSEEARALRQTKAGGTNPAWRVLHRVTYVERPALEGFGRDVRPLPQAVEPPLSERVQALQAANDELRQKVDRLLEVVLAGAKAAAAGA